MAIAKDIRSLPACQYLMEELGSEDAVEEEVNKFIEPLQGLVGFKAGLEHTAIKHGWQPPKPEPVYMSHLDPDYLETRNWRYSQDGKKAYATITLAAEVKQVGPVETYDYENADGDTVIQKYVDVTFVDDGFEETVRMKDADGFTSQAGKEIGPSYMATLWDNMRAAVGRRIKLSGVQVMRSEDFDGNERYMFSSGNFTRVEKVLDDDTVTEDDFEEGF